LTSVAATDCSRRVADHVFAVDIDPAVLDQARVRLAEAGMTNCEFIMADAMKLDAVVSEPVDYVLLANTFHGVPDQLGLARVVATKLKPQGQFGIVNWHRRPREETVVLGQPRGTHRMKNFDRLICMWPKARSESQAHRTVVGRVSLMTGSAI
jgi:ubiquinone/menaquinone biosynthesis C-methylase UbiE